MSGDLGNGRLDRIVCIGAGRMGRGMAHVFAYSGLPVTLVDFKARPAEDMERLTAEALEEIRGSLGFMRDAGFMTEGQIEAAIALVSVVGLDAADEAIADADLLLEGVPETREAKADALGRMSAVARPDAIIASTTSTMLVTELQDLVTGPERFLNSHFLNPAYMIPLVEISPGPTTDPDAVDRLEALYHYCGKVPVRCAASPGYIIPRLQSLLMSEAARMVHEGVATAEDIDKAIMYGFGPRYSTMGAIEFIDWGGVDIMYYACNYMAKALDSPRHAPPPEIEQMMADGRRGMREGQGYYDFRNMDVEAFKRGKLERFVSLLNALGQIPDPKV